MEVGVSFLMVPKQLFPSYSVGMVGHTALQNQQRVTNASSFPTWQGEASLADLVQPDDIANSESVLGIKPGYCSVVIGYQVDELTYTWSVQCFCFWLEHTFTPHLWVRCGVSHTSHLNWIVKIITF